MAWRWTTWEELYFSRLADVPPLLYCGSIAASAQSLWQGCLLQQAQPLFTNTLLVWQAQHTGGGFPEGSVGSCDTYRQFPEDPGQWALNREELSKLCLCQQRGKSVSARSKHLFLQVPLFSEGLFIGFWKEKCDLSITELLVSIEFLLPW